MPPDYEELEERFELRSNGTTRYVRYSHMVHLQADGDYTKVFLKDGTSELTSMRLGEHEQLLKDHPHFMRIHRSYIVNVRYVTAVDKDCTVHLQHGGPIVVTRKLYEALNERIPTRKQQEE